MVPGGKRKKGEDKKKIKWIHSQNGKKKIRKEESKRSATAASSFLLLLFLFFQGVLMLLKIERFCWQNGQDSSSHVGCLKTRIVWGYLWYQPLRKVLQSVMV